MRTVKDNRVQCYILQTDYIFTLTEILLNNPPGSCAQIRGIRTIILQRTSLDIFIGPIQANTFPCRRSSKNNRWSSLSHFGRTKRAADAPESADADKGTLLRPRSLRGTCTWHLRTPGTTLAFDVSPRAFSDKTNSS